MLRSLDDLSGVEGLDAAVLQRMQTYISVLPDMTWVNGNTARAEVLSAVVPTTESVQAQALVAERDGGHRFIRPGGFVNRLHLPRWRWTQCRSASPASGFACKARRGRSNVG